MPRPFAPAGSRRHPGWLLLLFALAALMPPAATLAKESTFTEVVKGFCLSAFQNEMALAGKQAPAGMADYACTCVAERINGGSSIHAARTSCREATARRYPI